MWTLMVFLFGLYVGVSSATLALALYAYIK
jgi:hypothetical protein